MVFVLGMTLKFQKFYMKAIFANSHPFLANTQCLKRWCDMTRLGNQNDFCVWNNFEIPKTPSCKHLKPKTLLWHDQTGEQSKMQLKLAPSYIFKESGSNSGGMLIWKVYHLQWSKSTSCGLSMQKREAVKS